MQLGYTPDYAEMITAGRIAAGRIFSPWQRYWCWPYYILVAFAAIVLMVSTANLVRPTIGNANANLVGICVLVGVYVVGVVIGFRIGRKLTARWLRQKKPERPMLFSIESNGLQWRSGDSLTQIGFADIDRVVVSRDLVGFVANAGMAYVPLRAFETSDQSKSLVRAVMERISDEAGKRSMNDAAVRQMMAV